MGRYIPLSKKIPLLLKIVDIFPNLEFRFAGQKFEGAEKFTVESINNLKKENMLNLMVTYCA